MARALPRLAEAPQTQERYESTSNSAEMRNHNTRPDQSQTMLHRITNHDRTKENPQNGEKIDHHSIFRNHAKRDVVSLESKVSSEASAPFLEVTVSKEFKENNTRIATSNDTAVYMTTQLVPDVAINALSGNLGQEIITRNSFDEEGEFAADTSTDIAGSTSRVQKSFSYDAEESCAITEAGVDSGALGRVHFPQTLNNVSLFLDAPASNQDSKHDIIVTRPFRNALQTTNEMKQVSAHEPYSTGNKARDDIMARARALLQAHEHNDEFDKQTLTPSAFDEHSVLDDGIAPLGGHWPQNYTPQITYQQRLNDPMNNLHWIHHDALKKLQVSKVCA
jgi:hypothetical protein